ncbi:MAG: SLBB domain-containing protein [Bacteroidetes bacterium]|nr:SLBB domain-containing protein [Bacteroidota bacterium]
MKKLFLLLILPIYLLSQGFEVSKKSDDNMDKTSTPSSITPFATPLKYQLILDGAINPSEYKIGPGDIFGLSIISSASVTLELVVSPEGTLLLPGIGIFNIDGLFLDQARTKIINLTKKKYAFSDINFVLLIPRTFKVSVLGEVEVPGVYTISATDRVKNIVAKANKDTLNSTTKNLFNAGSKRLIKILHKNGTESIADLELYKITFDSKLNPYLHDGDVIIVPKKQLDKNFIAIYGEVNFEGTYEFLESDNLKNLLLMAGSTTHFADLQKVEITRWDNSLQKVEIIKLDLISDPNNFQFQLKRGDRVNINSTTTSQYNYTIKIEGEVNQPGIYPITKESTYLFEIINRAGGFTKYALLNSAKIYRKQVSISNLELEKLESVRSNLAPEDIDYFNTETSLRINREIVVADFKKIFEDKNKSADVLLKSGDVISIPSTQKNIYVYGQVAKPGYLPLLSENNIDTYIEMVGGFLENAKSDEVKIIKANSKEWVDPDETTIEDGDYIFVPKVPYRPSRYYFETFRDIAALTTSLATLYLMIQQIGK